MIGARPEIETLRYPVSEVAAKYGASVAKETADPTKPTPTGRASTCRRACRGLQEYRRSPHAEGYC
jgi:hypothetical protein